MEKPKIEWSPEFFRQITNSNGDLDASTLGYQYTLQTTDFIRARVIGQKFYKVPIADFFTVIRGEGTWLEGIKLNAQYDIAGPFEGGIIGNASNQGQIQTVDVGTAPLARKLNTWAGAYLYSLPEIKKALQSINWSPIEGKMAALKRQWDLGIQKVGFLGILNDSDTPGLLTASAVTVDTTTITQNISAMSAADFATFVATLMGVYSENSNFTAMPSRFVIPLDDFLGLTTPVSSDFPVVDKLTYLLNAFKAATGNPNFEIKPLMYCMKDQNARYVEDASGRNRYVLYNHELDEAGNSPVDMDIPVDFNLTPAGTKNNFQFEGIGCGQFSGAIVNRPRELVYFDHI